MEGKHGAPYIMPDGSGRHLQDYLQDNSLREGQPRSRSRGKARQWERAEPPQPQGSAEADPDVALLLRVGRGKRRRWLADNLLRKMAGKHRALAEHPDAGVAQLYVLVHQYRLKRLHPCTALRHSGKLRSLPAGTLNAEQMESLFAPVPFGEPRVSALERIAAPEHALVWDMFRSIDPDKQARVLLVRACSPRRPCIRAMLPCMCRTLSAHSCMKFSSLHVVSSRPIAPREHLACRGCASTLDAWAARPPWGRHR